METSVNNKCKAFTSLEQSKKLAEILPIESADMRYAPFGDTHPWVWNEEVKLLEKDSVPCWSLAALLDILPLEVSFNKQTDGEDTYYYIASCDARYCDVHSHRHINVVDACYEMVIKLKERNLI